MGSLAPPKDLLDRKAFLIGYYRTGHVMKGDAYDIVGNLRIYADFGKGEVTTAVSHLSLVDVSDVSNPSEPVGGFPLDGGLWGAGTISKTTIDSELKGQIRLRENQILTGLPRIDIEADMSGKVYSKDGKSLVYGAITGKQARIHKDIGTKDKVFRNIRYGQFFASEDWKGNSVPDVKVPVVKFDTPPPGAGNPGSTMSRDIRIREYVNLGLIRHAIIADYLEAPSSKAFPKGKGILTGYVSAGSLFSDPKHVLSAGNLTIDADFDKRTVTARVSDFHGGNLGGSGTINRTTMNSTLGGQISVMGDTVTVDAELSGKVYNNDGTLLVHGIFKGDVTEGAGLTSPIENGEFYAVQN